MIDAVLILVYLALLAALAVTALSLARSLRLRTRADAVVNGVPRQRIGWLTAGGCAACGLITWLLGSADPLVTNGALFTSRFWLKTTDMFLYTSLILIAACFAGIIVNRFRS